MDVDPWLLKNLVCPRTKQELRREGDKLISPSGDEYPICHGVPVMLLPDMQETYWVAKHSWWLATHPHTKENDAEFTAEEKRLFPEVEKIDWAIWAKAHLAETEAQPGSLPPGVVDGFVQQVISSTSGTLWYEAIGKLKEYPMPDFRAPQSNGGLLLDVGCGWGRWCLASARKGYHPVGIDPSLWTVLAARRVAKQQGVDAHYVVADSRYMPFREGAFDFVNSFSVLQSMVRENVRKTLHEVGRVLKPGGASMIQMAQKYGIRQVYNRLRTGENPDATVFSAVRWWTVKELRDTFGELIGPTDVVVDSFLSVNAQGSEAHQLPLKFRAVIRVSDVLRHASKVLPFMVHGADSVYAISKKPGVAAGAK